MLIQERRPAGRCRGSGSDDEPRPDSTNLLTPFAACPPEPKAKVGLERHEVGQRVHRMKAVIFVRAVLAVVGFASLTAEAHAQCVIVDKPEELFARSDMVFRGTVVATESTGARGSHEVVEIATFRVDQWWKGDPTREVRIGADRAFEKDKVYLVFAAGKPLSTSILCRWTESIERAKPKLDWLLKNRRTNTPPKPPQAP